jgi:ketosteroid isomerase-like protein
MLACLAGTLPATAQSPSPAPPAATAEGATAAPPSGAEAAATPAGQPAGEDPAHDELRALRDGLLEAMNQGDVERELTYLHPNVVVTWHDATVSRGRDGVRAYLLRMLQGPEKKVAKYGADVNVDELTILYGGDTGISFGSAVEHFEMTSGRTIDLPARWSATLVEQDGRWLVASLHCSDNLFDNPLLSAARKLAYGAGGAGLLAGLLAGVFMGRRRRPG